MIKIKQSRVLVLIPLKEKQKYNQIRVQNLLRTYLLISSVLFWFIFSKSSHLPKVYTRTGDRGTSVLLGTGSNRLPKESLIFDVLGTLDELSSTIGIVRSTCSFPLLSKELENIQCSLFEIGSCVAANNRSSRFVFNDSTLIKNLEEQIDKMTEELPELRHFILPGGASQTGSYLHFSRAICRRCERLLTKWLHDQTEEQQDTVMGIYLNRLSDYLFTLARYITYKEGHKDRIYHKSK
jgi:cob(I)alamin adenosyltransferase